MKRTVALLLALMLVLTACSRAEAPQTQPTAAPTQAATEPTPETQAPTAPQETEAGVVSKFRIIDYDDPEWFVNAHIQDMDGDWPVVSLNVHTSKEAIYECAENYFNQVFKNTKVTDMTLCCFEQISYIETDAMDWLHKEVAKKVTENGPIENYYTISEKYQKFYDAVTEFDVDWYQLAIDYCKEAGVRPWIYLRMNDHHNNTDPNSPYHDTFWYTARDNGWLISNTDLNGQSVANAYDFAQPEVRQWMLDYIREVTAKYDVFGLELDFQREMWCFDYVNEPDAAEIMTQFVRDIAAIVEDAEKIHSHDMKLMIRLGSDVENNLIFGYDVATWAEERLIDAVVPSPHHIPIDSDIPVAEWVEAVGDEVAIFTGFDCQVMFDLPTSLKYVKGLAAGFMSQGADGLYFNNFYQISSSGPMIFPLSPDAVSEGDRTYVATCEYPIPIGGTSHNRLPLSLDGIGEEGLDTEVCMGTVREEEKIRVSVGYNLEDGVVPPMEITVNGISPVEVKESKINPYTTPGHYVRSDNLETQDADILIQYFFENISAEDTLVIHFPAANDCTVAALEVQITPN